MYKIIYFIILFVLITVTFSKASASSFCELSEKDSIETCRVEISICDTGIAILPADTLYFQLNQRETLLSPLPQFDDEKKKKSISALFAFPFPFGFVGVHRVMMGTKPWVPILYVATFGGCFGILPLIDFCVILRTKDITQYENNPNLFMWIK